MKGNLLLGLAKGKLGDIVAYRMNGQQMARPRIRNVANPRSIAQNIQRMVLATVTGNAAYLRPLISHSFQGYKAGQDNYNRFNKVNLDFVRGLATSGAVSAFRIKGAQTFTAVNGLILGEGRLEAPRVTWPEELPGLLISSFSTGINPASFTGLLNSEADYLQLLQDYFACQPGDEVAFLFVGQLSRPFAAEFDGFGQRREAVYYRRLVFAPWNPALALVPFFETTGSRMAKVSSAFLDYSVGGDGQPRTLDAGLTLYYPESGSVSVWGVDQAGEGFDTIDAAAVFVSRPDGSGGWLNSNTRLSVNPSSEWGQVDGVTGADIAPSYGNIADTSVPSSDYYLEQSVGETRDAAVADMAPVGLSLSSMTGPFDTQAARPALNVNETTPLYIRINNVQDWSRVSVSISIDSVKLTELGHTNNLWIGNIRGLEYTELARGYITVKCVQANGDILTDEFDISFG